MLSGYLVPLAVFPAPMRAWPQHLPFHFQLGFPVELATGALETTEIRAPIVVRLDGTNAEEGRALLAEANRPEVTVEKTMLEAAATAVRLAGEAG